MMHLLLVPFCIFLFFYLHTRRHAPPPQKKLLPPSPWKLPIIGNLHQISDQLPHRSLRSLSDTYGPLMLLQFGGVPVLVVSSAEAAEEIMRNQDLVFSNRPRVSIPHKMFYGSRDMAFAPYGEYWRQIRSISVLHLLSNRKIQSFRGVREEETSNMVERIRRSGVSVNLTEMIVSVTNDVICRVALGRKYEEDGYGRKLKKLLPEFVGLLGKLNMADYIPALSFINRFNGLNSKAENVAKQLDELLQSVIEEGKQKTRQNAAGEGEEAQAPASFLDILLEFQKENAHDNPVEDETIKAIIMDVFAAGTDTTATALEWAMAELLKNPRAMKTLQNEVRNVAKHSETITEEDLESVPYLKAVLKETLRLHPPIPLLVPRESTMDTKVMGYDVASRTRVIINAWAIGRDPEVWENAEEEFRPERFEGRDVDFRGLHFELIPFGGGRRGCPGTAFAAAVVEIALAKLVHEFDFVLPRGKPEDLDMSEIDGIAVHKRIPLVVDVIPYTR